VRELHSEIQIEAPPQRVWDVLVRFEDYPEWNPFIRAAHGEVRQGAKIRVTVGSAGRRPMTFSPRLLVADPPKELRWLGRVGLPRVFDGEHSFRLEPVGRSATHVVQHESFRGLLVPMMGSRLYSDSQKGFDELLRALKKRVEGARPGPRAKV
jgi:hypothetical protein